MEQEFTQEQQNLILETLSRYEETLIRRVSDTITEVEAAANTEFCEENLTFALHSPANADYLTLFLFGKLFDRLHRGDMTLAEKILSMEAKRLGITLSDI